MSQHREPLTRERIIDVALHIVDGQGLGRLTMRRLGDALAVEAMAIYHHLPRGKEELLDGLVTHVAALPVTIPAEGPVPEDWRQTLRRWAAGYRARLIEHAGVLPLLVTRRNPAALSSTHAALGEALRRAGAAEAVAATGAHAVLGYVIGHAALEVRGREVRTAADEVVDWEARFTAGLDLVLGGLAAAL